MENPGIDGRKIIKWVFEGLDKGARIVSIWLRIETGGKLL